MDISLFIAKRLRLNSRIAIISIAVSFFVIIVSVSISSGFRSEIRDGISSVSGDIQLTPVDLNYLDESTPIDRFPSYLGYIDSLRGVESVSPAVYRAGIVKNGDNIHGVLVKGVEKMAGAGPLPPSGVFIPASLSSVLNLGAGDDMQVYFVGEKVKVRKFAIAGVYDGIMDSGDNPLVFAGIDDMRRLNGWDSTRVSTLEVSLSPGLRNVKDMERMEQEVGGITLLYASDDDESVVASSSVSRYPQLFDWLNLIDFNVLFILGLMTLVAGFNMISGLLIMLFENISTIGILKSVGMDDRSIAKAFLASASATVLKGMFLGNAAALLFCCVQGVFRPIRLDPSNYFISFVPVHADPFVILAADIAAYMVIMLLLLIPSMFVSRIDPAKTVRMN